MMREESFLCTVNLDDSLCLFLPTFDVLRFAQFVWDSTVAALFQYSSRTVIF